MTASNTPVTVLVGRRDRHLFDGCHDSRIRIVPDAKDATDPDLIVFPCGQDRRLEKAAAVVLPECVLNRLASGATGVIFDASTEGTPHKPDVTASLHAFLHRFGVAPRRGVYVTQERNWEADYRAHCEAHGIHPVLSVMTHDYWIWYAFASYEPDGERTYLERREAFRRREPARARRFLSLNRTPRPIKVLFLLNVLRDGLWDQGYISFGGFKNDGPGKSRPHVSQLEAALPGFEDLVEACGPHLDALEGVGRVLLGMERHGWSRLELWNAGMAADLAEYQDSWFSLVTETEMRPRASRITEKVLKPLVNFHPSIVLGNPGALAMIREYGFATFPEIIDESYDDEQDPRRRYDLVYREFLRLCRLDERELARLEARAADTLDFNARWGLTEFPSQFRRRYDEALTDRMLAAVGHASRA
jgi:hypothetical protein